MVKLVDVMKYNDTYSVSYYLFIIIIFVIALINNPVLFPFKNIT